MNITSTSTASAVSNYSKLQANPQPDKTQQGVNASIEEDEAIFSPEALVKASAFSESSQASSDSTTLGPPTDVPDEPDGNP
ncbi:hypothetical protein [Acanthopleuribacter pedis]|uniref:Uncharacterized protein n=1 Tax=Acanthopleuribacter pedis TaxID=442870 RepID=A0A8J7QLP5_9BACT|nr:hypothetical protein [Acanthopleuribacter pedis]MBO1320260.1 hypothetical protein [Acanthopleuribacter pedis]